MLDVILSSMFSVVLERLVVTPDHGEQLWNELQPVPSVAPLFRIRVLYETRDV